MIQAFPKEYGEGIDNILSKDVMTQQSTVEEQYNKLVQIVHKYWDLGDEVGLHKEVLKEIQLAEQRAREEGYNKGFREGNRNGIDYQVKRSIEIINKMMRNDEPYQREDDFTNEKENINYNGHLTGVTTATFLGNLGYNEALSDIINQITSS